MTRIKSRLLTIPMTWRPRTTGIRCTPASSSVRAALDTSVPALRVRTGRVMTSPTVRLDRESGRVWAGIRSASLTMPASAPVASSTGSAEIPCATRSRAASFTGIDGFAVITGLDMISVTFTFLKAAATDARRAGPKVPMTAPNGTPKTCQTAVVGRRHKRFTKRQEPSKKLQNKSSREDTGGIR